MTPAIRVVPDPVLRRGCDPVRAFGPEIGATAYGLLAAMYAAGGYGIAAPQIGVTQRIIVIDVGWTSERKAPLVLVKPVADWRSDVMVARRESCLSIPGAVRRIARADGIRIAARDIWGRPVEHHATGPEAAILQHEIDHLDGVLMIDHPEAPE